MSPTKMEDSLLLTKAKELASNERKIQVDLLWHLLEINRRKLFLEIGFPSLYDYVVKELGYSHGSAYRRIQAMRLLESVPVVAKKIEEGSINISTAAQVQNFIKSEKKSGGNVSYKQRVEMVKSIENKSTRDVEKHLISLKPENVIQPERIRSVTAEILEMRLMIPEGLKEKLDMLRFYFSHSNPEMTYVGLIEYLAKKALLKIEGKKVDDITAFQKQSSISLKKTLMNPASNLKMCVNADAKKNVKNNFNSSRSIPSTLRHAIWLRDGGVCTYHDPKTGKKCGGRYQVQVDHIHPWSQGGQSTLENLQLLCAQHNRRKGARNEVSTTT